MVQRGRSHSFSSQILVRSTLFVVVGSQHWAVSLPQEAISWDRTFFPTCQLSPTPRTPTFPKSLLSSSHRRLSQSPGVRRNLGWSPWHGTNRHLLPNRPEPRLPASIQPRHSLRHPSPTTATGLVARLRPRRGIVHPTATTRSVCTNDQNSIGAIPRQLASLADARQWVSPFQTGKKKLSRHTNRPSAPWTNRCGTSHPKPRHTPRWPRKKPNCCPNFNISCSNKPGWPNKTASNLAKSPQTLLWRNAMDLPPHIVQCPVPHPFRHSNRATPPPHRPRRPPWRLLPRLLLLRVLPKNFFLQQRPCVGPLRLRCLFLVTAHTNAPNNCCCPRSRSPQNLLRPRNLLDNLG